MPEFFDFHLIVNRIDVDEKVGRYVTVVAEAPISRFGKVFGQFTLEESNLAQWSPPTSRLVLRRDPGQPFRIEWGNSENDLSSEEVGVELFRLLFPERSPARELLGGSCDLAGLEN